MNEGTGHWNRPLLTYSYSPLIINTLCHLMLQLSQLEFYPYQTWESSIIHTSNMRLFEFTIYPLKRASSCSSNYYVYFMIVMLSWSERQFTNLLASLTVNSIIRGHNKLQWAIFFRCLDIYDYKHKFLLIHIFFKLIEWRGAYCQGGLGWRSG